MIKVKGGFTLIEVSLFLAITGLLFLGVTIGVQNSIFQQRYNDSVQSFVEFLRTAYAKTENVQRTNNGGNTDSVIYGKLITFGEECNLLSSQGGCNNNTENLVFMYDVIGGVSCGEGFNGTLDALSACGANVSRGDSMADSYKIKWSAVIQNIKWNPFVGAILITRHPQSGTVSTFVMNNKTVQVNSGDSLSKYLKGEGGNVFRSEAVDFCINPNGDTKSGSRKDVRIKAGAKNSLGIEIMPDGENDCDKEKAENG